MTAFARVVFPRQEGNRHQLQSPSVDPLDDPSQALLEAYVTSSSVTIDVPLEPGEILPEAKGRIAARALEEIKAFEQFNLPIDQPGANGLNP
jgi:hypothetical protein